MTPPVIARDRDGNRVGERQRSNTNQSHSLSPVMTSTARLRPPTRVAIGPAFPSPKSTAKAHQETGDGTALRERLTERTHPSQCRPGWASGVRDGQLWLAYGTQQPSIMIAPLTAAEKIQLSSRTGSRQPLEALEELTSRNAHRTEVATAPLADHQPVTRCSDTP